jgi:hypothetical protein
LQALSQLHEHVCRLVLERDRVQVFENFWLRLWNSRLDLGPVTRFTSRLLRLPLVGLQHLYYLEDYLFGLCFDGITILTCETILRIAHGEGRHAGCASVGAGEAGHETVVLALRLGRVHVTVAVAEDLFVAHTNPSM